MNDPPSRKGRRLLPSGRQGRRPLEARRVFSRSAGRDLRDFFGKKFLKNLQKTFRCLVYLNRSNHIVNSSLITCVVVCPTPSRRWSSM